MAARRTIVRLVCAMVLLTRFIVAPTNAAEVARHLTTRGVATISITGEIVEGDADSLRREIHNAKIGGYSIAKIQLNSIGGNLFEGTSISRAIRDASLNTNVAAGDTCASVCFLAFAAGLIKSVDAGARVGVHAASSESGEETQASRAATAAMARIATLLGVSSRIIESMVSTPSSRMFWLDRANFMSMGAVIAAPR